MRIEAFNNNRQEVFTDQLLQCFTTTLPQGELNQNTLLQDKKGSLYVKRVPKEEQRILSALRNEYEELCFYQTGGFFTVRSPQEQVAFMQESGQKGLSVVQPLHFDGEDTILLPYIQGSPYHEYINQDPRNMRKIIGIYLQSIADGHIQGMIYGDRWGPNTIVTPAEKLVHIDFDIALHGESAKEFEISQAMYYSIYFASDRVPAIESCREFAHSRMFEMYNPEHIQLFLMMHSLYFGNGMYGGIAPDVQEVLNKSTP